MKILIAEDDPTIRANLLRTLRLEGYEPIAAENGAQALLLANSELPALVLSDVSMPELDGHQLLQALRADPRFANLPFVFLTARAGRSDVREGMTLGADDYLTKPFQREELLQVVSTQLRRGARRAQETLRLEQETQRLRYFDPVTDLPNRQGLEQRLHGALQVADRNGYRLALVSLGLDGLAEIRQTQGARVADRLLRRAADELLVASQKGVGGSDRCLLVRLSEERFGIVLHDVGEDNSIDVVVREFVAAVAAVRDEDGTERFFSPYAGISVYPRDAAGVDTLMQHAEAAEPPPTPAGSLAFFSAESNQQLGRRVLLLNALHGAQERNELSLQYQPQVETRTDRVLGFEALLRWHHPQFGFVSPAEFIPIAEDTGLIVPIGAWVLEQAARQAQEWLNAGLAPLRVAVNLAARQFSEDDLPGRVERLLADTGLPPASLELEITESVALQSAERTLSTLKAFKALGVHLAMDDFGTGYSSLAYLKRYPLDSLKIDQVFVRNLTTDASDAAIARAIVALAHSLNLSVIAEGVETQAHVDYLDSLGCEICQGFHFSRPLPPEQATDWLLSYREARQPL